MIIVLLSVITKVENMYTTGDTISKSCTSVELSIITFKTLYKSTKIKNVKTILVNGQSRVKNVSIFLLNYACIIYISIGKKHTHKSVNHGYL